MIRLLLASSLIAGSAVSQTTVVLPPGSRKVEGNSLSVTPFGYDRCRFSQYLGAKMLLGVIPQGKQITEIAYRRDGRALNTALLKHPTTPPWSVRMSNYTRDASNPGYQYLKPGLVSNTLTTVFSKVFAFPQLPGGSGPMSFRLRFKLDRPFLFTGAGLVIDHFVYTTNGRFYAYYVDAVRGTINHGSFSLYGKACPAGKNRISAIPSNPGGDPMSVLLFGGLPQTIATLLIGDSNARWGSIRLPIDLSPLGMRGCSLLTSILLTASVGTRTTGSAEVKFNLPADPLLKGIRLYAQWMLLDPQINGQAPFTFSDGAAITLGTTVGKRPDIDGAALYGTSTLARSSYGFVDPGFVLVTEITYK